MANYSLVANTQFKARTFDDLIRPYLMYTQEYRTQEEALADLATKADVWAGLTNEQTDPIAHAQYTNYANALKNQAAILADRGLDQSSRQALLNLRRRYSSEIAPIAEAYDKRKRQAAEQAQALLQNPTLMMSRRADATSLDRYLENPNLGYDAYSGALLTNQVGQAAATLAKELKRYGRGEKLDGFTRTWIQQHGYTAAEVAFAINNPNDPRANNVLNSIVNNVIADSGIANWADNKTLNQAYSYARQGLWQAVGQTQVGTYTDQAAVMAAQRRAQQTAVYGGGNGKVGIPGSTISLNFNNKNTASKEMKKEAAKQTADYLEWRATIKKDPDAIKAKKYWENQGDKNKSWKEKAAAHWAENGFEGISKSFDGGLRGHLSKTLNAKKELIDIWLSPYVRTHVPGIISPTTGVVVSSETSSEPAKNWKDWDDLATTAYKFNAVALHDDRSALNEYLKGIVSRNTAKAQEIESISSDGTINYRDVGHLVNHLPKDSNGNIQYDKIHRSMLPNFDYVLNWVDNEGKPKQVVLRRQDISQEEMKAASEVTDAEKALFNYYTKGQISSEEYIELLSGLGTNNLYKTYALPQLVDIKSFEIK